MNRIFLIIILVFLFKNFSFEQEQLGLHLENHSGINAISVNPSNSFLTSYSWDFNIASAGVFFKNDYAFAKNTNTLKIVNHLKTLNFQIDSSYQENNYAPELLAIDFYNRKKESYVVFSGNMTGPSISIKLNKKSSIGFISRLRFLGGTSKIPLELNYYTFYNRPFSQTFQLSEINAGFISWQEYGINSVQQIQSYPFIALLGATVKYLSGNEAMYFKLKSGALFKQLHGDSLAISDRFNLEYGYTNTSINSNRLKFKNNGFGLGLDIGATFVLGEKLNDYKFRLGISILDLGFIRFNNNSSTYKINVDSTTVVDLNQFKEIRQLSDLESINAKLSSEILKNSDKSFDKNSFNLMTPTALSVQIDYSISKLFYIQAFLLQRIKPRNQAVTRPNIFAISPRIEHGWFSFSPSMVIYDWKAIHLGTSIRLAYLIIGSDNLSGLIKDIPEYTGSDIYVGLKFNPLALGRKNKYGKNLNRKIKCYKF